MLIRAKQTKRITVIKGFLLIRKIVCVNILLLRCSRLLRKLFQRWTSFFWKQNKFSANFGWSDHKMAAENLSQMIQSREFPYPLKVDTVMHTLLSDKHINFCAIFISCIIYFSTDRIFQNHKYLYMVVFFKPQYLFGKENNLFFL